MSLTKKTYQRSLRKAIDKTNQSNNTETAVHVWITNDPKLKGGIAGAAKYGMACTTEKVALIRGPFRGMLETAGVIIST